MVLCAAAAYDGGEEAGACANAAEYGAAEAGFRACETAIMTHGGMGWRANTMSRGSPQSARS